MSDSESDVPLVLSDDERDEQSTSNDYWSNTISDSDDESLPDLQYDSEPEDGVVHGPAVDFYEDHPKSSLLSFGTKLSHSQYLEKKKDEPVSVRTGPRQTAAEKAAAKQARKRELSRKRQQKHRDKVSATRPPKKPRKSVNVELRADFSDVIQDLVHEDEATDDSNEAGPSKRKPGRPKGSKTKARKQHVKKTVPEKSRYIVRLSCLCAACLVKACSPGPSLVITVSLSCVLPCAL
jgi:hypothetical protein